MCRAGPPDRAGLVVRPVPDRPRTHSQLEPFAATSVASLRREAGRHPHDRRLIDLIDELRAADVDVARWWDDHAVRDCASVAKRIAHPTADPLAFDIEIVAVPHEPDQTLVVYNVEPDSPTARVLPILASWAGSVTR